MAEFGAAGVPAQARPRFCPDCGYQAAEGQAFCVACGRQNVIDVSDAALAQATPTPIPAPRPPQPYVPAPVVSVPTAPRNVPAYPPQPGLPQAAIPLPRQPWPAMEQLANASPVGAPVASVLPHGWVPASFGQRVAARLLDAVAIGVISLLLFAWFAFVTAAIGASGRLSAGFLVGAVALVLLLPTGIWLIYRIGSDIGRGRSLGRSAVGIRLVKIPQLPAAMPVAAEDDAVRVGVGTALGRLIVGVLGDCIFFLSSLSVLWHPQKRSWGDLAGGTAVIVDDRGEKTSAWRPPLWAAAFSALLCVGVVLLNQAAPSLDLAGHSGNSSTFTTNDPASSDPGGSLPGTVPSDPPSTGSTGSGSGTQIPPPVRRAPVVPPPTTYTQPDGNLFTVKEPIVVRSGPTKAFPSVSGSGLVGGNSVVIVCQTHGEQVTGPNGASDLWDRISYPLVGYVSDEFIYTGTTGTDAQVAPLC